MQVFLNGKAVDLEESSRLVVLLENQGLDLRGVALALNGKVLIKARWQEQSLVEGDRIEAVRAVGGG